MRYTTHLGVVAVPLQYILGVINMLTTMSVS